MNAERDIDLVKDLIARPAETSWVEFKKDNIDPKMIGVRCSALSNAARVDGKDCAYMLWGIDDQSHSIIGTTFDPDTEKSATSPSRCGWRNRCPPVSLFPLLRDL